jgi:branched-chain amino acid transport system substrate-binding protein
VLTARAGANREAVMLHRVIRTTAAAVVVFAAVSGLARPASAQDILKVGAPLPLTGPLSPEGTKQKQGYDLWAATANDKGGIKAGGRTYKIEIVYVDYASNTPRAVQSAERLISEDKVNFLFSPFGSGAAKAASGVSEKYGIPTLAATASSSQVYDQGYKYLFGTFTPNDTLTEPLADIVAKRNPAVKRIAILARNDLFPLAIAEEMQTSAKKRGLDVVMFEKYAIGTMDHASTITQIRMAKPEWVFATGYINDLILIRKQMKDLGVSAPVVTMVAGPHAKEYIDATGPLAENITSAAWWHPAVRYNGKGIFGSTENFNKMWAAMYPGVEADYSQASAAGVGEVLQLAIESVDSIDPAKVRDALAKMDTETFFGRIKFGPTGQITSLEPPVFQIQGGKPTVIFPDYIKQAELKFGVQ